MRFIKLLGLIIVFIVITGIGYLVYVFKTSPKFQGGSVITKPSNQYLAVFNDSIIRNLKADNIIKPKYDSTICRYLYDNDNYVIQEYIINIKGDKTLPDLIEVIDKNELNINGVFSNEIRSKFFTMNYKTISPIVNYLKVSLYGSEIKTVIKNDTVLLLYSNIKNASIEYNSSDTSAVFCRPNQSLLPIEFLFIKKKRMLYFLMMSINREKVSLPQNMLYTLIK